jgi:hypothetical protein
VTILEAGVADVARRDLERRRQAGDRVEGGEPPFLDPEKRVRAFAGRRVRRDLLDDESVR